MGWSFTTARKSLTQHQEDHVRSAVDYGDRAIARIIMHEWQPSTWYALIGFYDSQDSQTPSSVFLRVDMIDTAGGFGYKDMSEEMGPYVDVKPSPGFADAVYRHKPKAEGFARQFRDRVGIKYDE